MLHTEATTILGFRNADGELVGTVASCPLSGTFVKQGETISQRFFQVECLVLHPSIRGKGLAGWLLAWLDYCTSQRDSVIHTWMRESLHTRKLPQRKIAPFRKMRTAQARYVDLVTRPHPERVDAIPWPTVHALLHSMRVSDNYGFDMLYIPNESPTVTWWRVEIPDHPYCAMVVGIASSHRRRLKQRIFYVVCTFFVRTRPDDRMELKDPFWYEEDTYCPYIQGCIEAAACAQTCDIVTVSNHSACGDPFLKKWEHWTVSKRNRKLYFYNWNHPLLGNGKILWPVV
jgi:GNAT superfamily N-acetyltransferase